MASKTIKKKSVKKKRTGAGQRKGSFLILLRHWSLPLFLLLLVGISLAATFYLVFLHTPSTPLF